MSGCSKEEAAEQFQALKRLQGPGPNQLTFLLWPACTSMILGMA